jgi:hypothetical protein
MTTDTGSRTSADQQPRPTRPRPKSIGHDLPRVPRRYGQWAGAVLFVVMAVLLAGWFWQQKSDREEVLAVAGVTSTISHEDAASVVGSTAAVGLVEGQILAPDMVTSKPLPGPGERVVGLQLDATRAPSGLLPGDVVVVLAVPPAGDPSSPAELDDPTVLAPKATVASAEVVEGAGTRLALVVPESVAERVTAYVAAGRVALVQAPIGGDG